MAAGHTLDTFTNAIATLANPSTFTYTCGAGTTVFVLFWLIRDSAPADSRGGGAPTYNGVTMTQSGTEGKAATSPETANECWYLLNPPTGSAFTCSVPFPSFGSVSACDYSAASFKANSGTSIWEQGINASNTSTNPDAGTITTTHDGSLIISAVGTGANTWAPTAQTGTVIANKDAGAAGYGVQYNLQSTAGGQAVNWTFTAATEDWAIVGGTFYDNFQVLDRVSSTTPNMKIGSRLKPHAFSPGNSR